MGLKIELSEILEIDKWNSLQEKIARLIEFRLLLVDKDGSSLSEASCIQPYCIEIAKQNQVKQYCTDCNQLALKKAAQTKQPYLFSCQLGVVDIVIPIVINEQFLGALIAGQIRLNNQNELLPILPFENDALRRQVLAQHRDRFYALPEKSLKEVQQVIDFLSEISTYLISESLKKNYFINAYKHALHLEIPSADYLVSTTKKKNMPSIYQAQNPLLQPAVDVVLENKATQYTLSELADITNLSPAYLSRLIKEEFGDSFNRLYRRLKMNWALELLEDQTLPIHEISQQLGYPDASYFIRLFKQTIGMTPLKYRKQQKKAAT